MLELILLVVCIYLAIGGSILIAISFDREFTALILKDNPLYLPYIMQCLKLVFSWLPMLLRSYR